MANWNDRIAKSRDNSFAFNLNNALSGVNIKECTISTDGYNPSSKDDMNGNDAIQLTIMEMHNGTYKVRSKYNESIMSSFEQAFDALVHLIKSFRISEANSIKFYSPVIPKKAIEFANLETFGNVNCRYIIDYEPSSDILIQRWDVIISRGC